MNYKKLTAIPKTAEEITGVKGCMSFSFYFKNDCFDIIYTPEMNKMALEGKRIEIEPLKKEVDNFYEYYDYKSGQYYWRKEWLKDFREGKKTPTGQKSRLEE